jgi:hypothetical protein
MVAPRRQAASVGSALPSHSCVAGNARGLDDDEHEQYYPGAGTCAYHYDL